MGEKMKQHPFLDVSPLLWAQRACDFHHGRFGRWSHKRKRRFHIVSARRQMAKASRRNNRKRG